METTTTELTADLNTADVVIRMLASGGAADERFPVPSKQRFKDAGQGVIEAEDLARISHALISDDSLPLGHLANLRIEYLWAERGGNQGGFPCFGRLIKSSKVLLHFAEVDYVVMLSADHLRDAKATRWQVEALVGHQLGHIDMLTTEKGEDRYSVKGHDFEGFTFEFKRWGAYLPGMVIPAQAASSAVQMGLVFEAGDDDEEGYDPSVGQAPGVEDERGPVDGGAPDPDWAEPFELSAEEMTEADLDHDERVRAAFPKQFKDGTDTCRACGLSIADHSTEECAGSNLNGKRGRRKIAEDFSKIQGEAQPADSEESGISGEDRVLGHLSASPTNGNGSHDEDDVAGILLDPDKVMATLAELGKSIAYQELPDGSRGYLNPTTGERYSAQWVEGEYRAAVAGRAR